MASWCKNLNLDFDIQVKSLQNSLVTHTMAVSPVLHGTGSTHCTSSVMTSVPFGKFNKVAKTEFKRTMIFLKMFSDLLPSARKGNIS